MRSDLCTGLFYIQSNTRTRAFLLHVMHNLANAEPSQIKFGDQGASNLVLFERLFRPGIEALTIGVLDQPHFPTGALHFVANYSRTLGVQPVLVHNNYLIGHEQKIERFVEAGMWFMNLSDSADTLCLRSWPLSSRRLSIDTLTVDSLRMERGEEELVIGAHGPCPAPFAVVVVSLDSKGVGRPWLSLVLERFTHYARRISADLILRTQVCRW